MSTPSFIHLGLLNGFPFAPEFIDMSEPRENIPGELPEYTSDFLGPFTLKEAMNIYWRTKKFEVSFSATSSSPSSRRGDIMSASTEIEFFEQSMSDQWYYTAAPLVQTGFILDAPCKRCTQYCGVEAGEIPILSPFEFAFGPLFIDKSKHAINDDTLRTEALYYFEYKVVVSFGAVVVTIESATSGFEEPVPFELELFGKTMKLAHSSFSPYYHTSAFNLTIKPIMYTDADFA